MGEDTVVKPHRMPDPPTPSDVVQLMASAVPDSAGVVLAVQQAAKLFAEFQMTTSSPTTTGVQRIAMQPGGFEGATSTKVSNVVLNMHKLMTALASGAITIGGALTAPWILVLGGLITWDRLWSCLKVPLSEREASVLWSIWSNGGSVAGVLKRDVLTLVNDERERYQQPPLGEAEITLALGRLEKMGCIRVRRDPPRLWVRESVSITYE